MKKIIHKIAGLALGLSLAMGVGVVVFGNSRKALLANAGDNDYTLFSGALEEGDYLVVYDGKAMNTTVSKDRLQYGGVTPVNDVITTTDASIIWHIASSGDYWTLYNAEANAYAASTGAKNKAQMLADGTDDKSLWTVTGTTTYEFVNKANAASSVNANLRNNGTYGFACYATSTGGALSLYKKSSSGGGGGETPTSFNVHFYDGDTLLDSLSTTVVEGGTVSQPANPTKDGYTFSGWFTDNGTFNNEYNFSSAVTEDLDLFAKWDEVQLSGNYFEKVLSQADLVAGNYLIVSETDSIAFDGSRDTLDAGQNGFAVVISDGKIAEDSENTSKYFTLSVENSAWTITSASGQNCAHSGSSNGLNGSGTNTISISEGVATILGSGGKGLAYNSTTGASNERFRYYTSPASNNNHAVSLFKYTESADPSLKTMVLMESGSAADGESYDYSSSGSYTFEAYEESTKLNDVVWSVNNEDVAQIDASTGVLTIVAPGSVTVFGEKDGYNKASAIITISKGTLMSLSISGSMSKTSYTTNESWSHDGLVVTATYDSGWEEEADANWTFNPAAPAEGVTGVVATATIGDIHTDSDEQEVEVTVVHAGTAEDPFTVAEGIAKAQEIGNKSGGEGPWITTGKISSIVQVLTSGYQNARFYITEDGKTTSPSIYAYDCKYLENAGFTEETAANMIVGASVTITGNLLNYNNNTPEYARGCYLLDIQQPETGDVDVTFNPESTSFEIGATGTFTASSETQGVSYSWSVDDSSVLIVDENSGEFEAVGLGVARVTVTASKDDKEGFAFVDITVNGNAPMTVAEANTLAAGLASGNTTSYYIYVKGYVAEFATSQKDGNPRAFDICDVNETDKIMVYTNVDPYSSFIEGLELGSYVVVKANVQNYSGTFELTSPEKVDSSYSALQFAHEFMTGTDAICSTYEDGDDNSEALGAIWDGFATKFNSLSESERAHLENDAGCGSTIVNAMKRYDYLVGRYSNLDAFVQNRVINGARTNYIASTTDSAASTIIIVVVALTSITSIGVLLVIKRRRTLMK